jgi:hypothetical protein
MHGKEAFFSNNKSLEMGTRNEENKMKRRHATPSFFPHKKEVKSQEMPVKGIWTCLLEILENKLFKKGQNSSTKKINY